MEIKRCAFALMLALCACAGSKVQESTDKTVDLSRYKTYQWLDQNQATAMGLQNPSIGYMTSTSRIETKPDIEQEVRPLIEGQLRQGGYVPNGAGNPDFLVTFYTMGKDKNWISSWDGTTSSVFDVPVVIFPGFNKDKTRDYRPGDFYIVFYDSRSKRPAWTGVVHGHDTEIASGVRSQIAEFEKNAGRTG